MEFRTLAATDIFPMCSIIKKIGFREFKECFNVSDVQAIIENPEGVESLGFGIAMDIGAVLIEHLPDCQDDIMSFFASVTEKSKKEIEKLPLSEFIEMLIEFFSKPEFKDFFKVVSKFLK